MRIKPSALAPSLESELLTVFSSNSAEEIIARDFLESMGFIIERVENDGGTNIVCWARKP